MVAQTARDPHDEIVQIAAPCADDNEDDADKCGEGNHHENIVRYPRNNALIVQKDQRHAESQKEDREQRTHDDEHGRLSRRHPRMAQEHDLCHGAPRRTGRQKGEKIVAKDHLHRLIERNPFV